MYNKTTKEEAEMTNDEQQQYPDSREPSDERKVELETAYKAQKEIDAPYKGIQIRTIGEVRWIMEQRNWSGEDELPNGMERANFSGAIFGDKRLSRNDRKLTGLSGNSLGHANLSGIHFAGANLSEASLIRSNLTAANLRGANLNYAGLNGAYITEAELFRCHLERADLTRAVLTDVTLSSASLTHAILTSADLT